MNIRRVEFSRPDRKVKSGIRELGLKAFFLSIVATKVTIKSSCRIKDNRMKQQQSNQI